MAINVAINGYGRIGRMILRALYERKRTAELRVVAINDLGDVRTNVHLTRYDSVHGRFPGEVHTEGGGLIVEGDPVRVLSQRSPAQLPWGELDVDVVLECTGLFRTRESATQHLTAGAGRCCCQRQAVEKWMRRCQ